MLRKNVPIRISGNLEITFSGGESHEMVND